MWPNLGCKNCKEAYFDASVPEKKQIFVRDLLVPTYGLFCFIMGQCLWGREGGRPVPRPWKLQPRRKGEQAKVTKPPENRSDGHLPICSRHISREPSVHRPVQDAAGSARRSTSHPLGSRQARQKREGES